MRGKQIDHGSLSSLHGWFPVALSKSPSTVWWRFLGAQRFTASFFQDTLTTQSTEQRLVCQTPFAALDTFNDSVPPTAFIFHVSRCGSTLLTQLLASLDRCIVMSEPPVIDSFLRFHHAQPESSGGAHALRKLIAALGQRRQPEEQNFFVKLDSWHIHSLPLIRKAFPDTPCLFLYRQPAEVLRSHQRQRGPQMVPGLIDPALLRLDASDLAPADLDGYCVRMLESFFTSGLEHAASGQMILLNYTQLPEILWSDLLARFAMPCTPAELANIQARSGFHSKHATNKFDGDPLTAPHAANAVPSRKLASCYAQLEQLRMNLHH